MVRVQSELKKAGFGRKKARHDQAFLRPKPAGIIYQ